MGGITDISWQAARGEPVRASQINGLVGAVRSLQPVESPTIRWERGPNGMAAHVRAMRSGGGTATVRQQWECWIDEEDGSPVVRVMGGWRGPINMDASLVGSVDGTWQFTPVVGTVFMRYTLATSDLPYGEWDDAPQLAAAPPASGLDTLTVPLASIYKEGEDWQVRQRQFGDVRVLDLYRLFNPQTYQVIAAAKVGDTTKVRADWVRAH